MVAGRMWSAASAAAIVCALSSTFITSAIAQEVALDGIVVTSSKVEESAIDALSGSSVVTRDVVDEQYQPDKVSEVLRTLPGVITQETARDTATAINIRGLQDFGRVNVLVDGARQNFQRSGHAANGVVYIEPEMIKRVDVTRGPTATVYGSGAIGGVAAFELIDADDILRGGEYAAGQTRVRYNSNGEGKLASQSVAARVGNFDIVAQFNGRWNNDYEDGNGDTIPGSADTTKSEMVKLRWRPAEGHEFTAAAVDYDSNFIDQVEPGGTERDTTVDNTQFTVGYTFKSPTNPLIDFSAKMYRVDNHLDQVRLTGETATFFTTTPFNGTSTPCPGAFGPCFATTENFPIGSERSFNVLTEGFDVFNTSRVSLPNSTLALTYGGDVFKDTVNTVDTVESGDEFTPSGEREVKGAFVQGQLTLFDIVELVGAVRYDSYSLESTVGGLEDDHVSPKVTAAVTPVPGLTMFATYAEGFRAPSVTETLNSGFHPGFAHFLIVPNAELRPEVAHNTEGGVNLKYNNVVTTGDAFRAKVTVFQNKVDDFIDEVFTEGPIAGVPTISGFNVVFTDDTFQYQNISNATLRGIEFEAAYDAGSWFAGLSAHRIRGKNDDTGAGLRTVPADQAVLTLGFRALDEKLVAGGRARFVSSQTRFIEDTDSNITSHTDGYAVFDLFSQYEINSNAIVNVNINNVTDKAYRQHLDQFNSPGFSARAGLTVRLGAD